eukprot:TRINITY_DN2449_c0_g1_i2.p1 TRINITY_DN2449_c0_g1~~TRINITY_DN2449_c0_g1_i2.p1  ORF type:complete len:562 (+),score=136.25 TRINITY_DN2449_c0_g1_i2:79-1686(+)
MYSMIGFAGVIVLFTFAYKLGVMMQGSPEDSALITQSEVDALHVELAKCDKANLENLENQALLGEVHEEEYKRVKKLEELSMNLHQETSDLDRRLMECRAQRDSEKEMREAQDKEDIETIARLEAENAKLKRHKKKVESGGLETSILISAIGRISIQHNRLRKSLNQPQVTVTPEYLDDLMMQWSSQNKAEFQYRLGNILPPNATELSDLYQKPTMINLEDGLPKGFLFTSKLNETAKQPTDPLKRLWTVPSWRNQTGNRRVVTGIKLGAPPNKGSISKQMSTLYEYVLCAAGNNVTDLAFPTAYQRDSATPVEYLHNLIVTPYVAFCKNCMQQQKTDAFHLLCQGYGRTDHYGSSLFWHARSRIVPTNLIRNMAEMFITSQITTPGLKNVLAVRIPRSPKWQDKCETFVQSGNPLLFFSRLLQGKVSEVHADPSEQCDSPSVKDSLKHLIKQHKYDGVLIISEVPVDLGLGDEVALLQIKPDTTKTPSVQTLLEIEVASQMQAVLVNRYDQQSIHITESFMIRNNLNTSKISVW